MAKRFVKVSLATKFRLLLGTAVLAIIIAALVVPWYFMELLAQRGLQHWAAEVTRLRLAEWDRFQYTQDERASDAGSLIVKLHSGGAEAEGRAGPFFVPLRAGRQDAGRLDETGRKALKAFAAAPSEELVVIPSENARGQAVFRCFRAVRANKDYVEWHGSISKPGERFHVGQLVGLIDVTLPASAGADPILWWTRGAFIVGVVLAALLAFMLLATITQRLILRPVTTLRNMADKVAEGDLTSRNVIRTGDEFERLGESFNDMLDAIEDQHEKLRAANRALDLKLHELSESNVALFQANKIKDEFLANVSHELRTPLNSILGFADLLSESPDDRIGRYGANIRTAARNLLSMINDLLDLAKIEAGKADVRWDRVSVAEACRTLLALMRPLADKKQLELRDELSDDLPIITTDPGKLQQILYNLLSNALKFTPPGGRVTLSAGRSAQGAFEGHAQQAFISVTDTGPGLSEADQEHVFEKFHRIDNTLTKESSGTGLGLAIARELTSLLGGRLVLKSSPGHGAVFTLYLPIEPASL